MSTKNLKKINKTKKTNTDNLEDEIYNSINIPNNLEINNENNNMISKTSSKSISNKEKKVIEENDNNTEDNNISCIGIKKDNVWKHIFNEIKYDGTKDICITAEQIKKCKKSWKGENCQFEPRLLCKQDCDDDRPQIFKDNNLCIISIKNGEYLLTKNNIYFKLPYHKTKTIEIEKNDDSLLLSIGNSETSLIDNLRYSGLFEKKQYLGETILFGPLLNGRHRCSFVTKIGNKEISIDGSQYETDSCYESKNKILLIEGKSVNNIESFNIRQLYYPYRTIYEKVKGIKEIISLFINKDKNNIIHIWKFEFENPLIMTSIKCISYNTYEFD